MGTTRQQDEPSRLVYDGDCGFCRYTVDYARALEAPGLVFEPYQQAAARYPGIALQEFRDAVQLFEPDGRHTRAAAASFRTLALAGRPLGWRLYRHLPGFAPLAERLYHVVARHRGLAYRIARGLWGEPLRPASHVLVSALFLRLLGLVFLPAFASFLVQADGLIGSRGIVPVADYLDFVRARTEAVPWAQFPTLFWLGASDRAIQLLCWAGIGTSLLLTAGLLPRLSVLALYLLYLSLVHAGQVFMSYQWDILLLETGVHALLLLAWPALGLWACRFLLFRFMFEAGVAKLASADPTWADWSALRYHFETQPLPTPLAWYAHHAPATLLEFAAAATLAIEILLPLLIFLPRRLRLVPLAGFALLQVGILLTGNYNFFNLLALALCVLLLDDRQLATVLPARVRARMDRPGTRPAGRMLRLPAAVLCAVIVVVSAVQLRYLVAGHPLAVWQLALLQRVQPWFLCNTYGLFAVMTTQRPEILIEGSDDLARWRAYDFRYKPGEPPQRLGWNIPHQPRLDWQLWFAALAPDTVQPWFHNLAWQLLSGSEPVRGLLAGSAFRDAPPRFLRARLFDYRFSTPAERAAGAPVWQRKPIGEYYPPTQLPPPRELPDASDRGASNNG